MVSINFLLVLLDLSVSVLVKSHFASVENNILSDIRSFHMNMLEGGFDNRTDDNSSDSRARGDADQYLISSFKPERLSWSSHEPRSEISSTRDRQSTDKTRPRQNPTNFVNNHLFADVSSTSGGKYSTLENKEEKFEMRSQPDADIANHRQYDIRYSDEPLLPEQENPAPMRISPAVTGSKQANMGGGGRSRGHNGQFYEGENVERGDFGHQLYEQPTAERFLAERQSRYQDRGRGDHTRHQGGYQDHHPMSRPQSVTRRLDPGPGGYYDPVYYEDSQGAYTDQLLTRHQTGADRQLAPVQG